jgi:hypothetical protein
MSNHYDLDAALKFVTARITQEGQLSGRPLTKEQALLLEYTPQIPASGAGGEFAPLAPRDPDFERLCTLARDAYVRDRDADPQSRNWEFAEAVFRLNNDRMWSVLVLTGLTRSRPWLTPLAVSVAGAFCIVGALYLVGKWSGWSNREATGIVIVFMAGIGLTYYYSVRTDMRALEQQIEGYRHAAHFLRQTAE